jgi:hypothetical protein
MAILETTHASETGAKTGGETRFVRYADSR